VTACPTVEGFALEASTTEEAACIFSASAAEVAPALDESPPYVAVIECVPLAKAEVENVATPDASVTLPIAAPLSKNCTVPAAAEGVTVAVNVTACPTVKGFALEASATEEAAFTFWLSAAETAPAFEESPPYDAVMECVPWVSMAVENDAPPDPSVAVPIAAPLSKNCTLPVAVKGVTVAVNVTVWPEVDGLALDATVSEEAVLTIWVTG
jgi:hypothetical protein